MRYVIHTALQRTSVRFLIAGGGAAVLFALLSFGALSMRMPPFLGTLAAYAITVVSSYAVQRSWTFRGRHCHGDAFPRYLAAQLAMACTTATAAQALARRGMSAAAISLCVTLAGSAGSFCLSRFWVFAPRR